MAKGREMEKVTPRVSELRAYDCWTYDAPRAEVIASELVWRL